jgi:hypothetical protein
MATASCVSGYHKRLTCTLRTTSADMPTPSACLAQRARQRQRLGGHGGGDGLQLVAGRQYERRPLCTFPPLNALPSSTLGLLSWVCSGCFTAAKHTHLCAGSWRLSGWMRKTHQLSRTAKVHQRRQQPVVHPRRRIQHQPPARAREALISHPNKPLVQRRRRGERTAQGRRTAC